MMTNIMFVGIFRIIEEFWEKLPYWFTYHNLVNIQEKARFLMEMTFSTNAEPITA